MKPSLHLALILLSILIAGRALAQPTFQWAQTVSNVASPGQAAYVRDADVHTDGTVYVSGAAGGPRVIVGDTIVGGTYVARYDTSGNLLWARSPGGGVVAVNSIGDLYTANIFSGTMQFGPSTLMAAGQDVYVAKYSASGTKLWAQKMGGTLDDVVYDIETDGLGRVHVSGHFRGTATFGATTLVATHDTTGFHATLDANGNFQWAVLAGGFETWNTGQPWPYYSNALACDALGNSYVAGIFAGTASFGSTSLTSTAFDEVFLARFDPNGNCSWVETMGANYGNILVDIALSATGGAYILGTYWGPQVTFDSITLTNSDTNVFEVFLACYDANGNALWADPIAPTAWQEQAIGLEVDDAGNVWALTRTNFTGTVQVGAFPITGGQFLAQFDATGNVLFADNIVDATGVRHVLGAHDDLFLFGNCSGSEVFDPDSGLSIATALSGGVEGYLARYHQDLSFHWLQHLGLHGAAHDGTTGMIADALGNVYATGNFTTTAIICGDTLRAPLATSNIWLGKRDANGNCLWTVPIRCSETYEANASNTSASIVRDAAGDLYITGTFFGTIDFGTVQLTSAGSGDLFLAKFDGAGNCLWAIRDGDADKEGGVSLSIDAAGALIVAGNFAGTTSIAGQTLTSAGNTDGFLAKYDNNGSATWAERFGGTSWDDASNATIDTDGNTYVCGRFTSSASFDGLTVNGTGSTDLYLAKYDPSGGVLWLSGSTGTGSKQANAVAIGANGLVYMTGSHQGDLTICTSTLSSNATDSHAFLGCFDASGNLLWQRTFPGPGGSGYALAARPGGDVVLSGGFIGSIAIGAISLAGGGEGDAFLAAFNSAGDELWANPIITDGGFFGAASASEVVADAQNVIVAGAFGDIQFTAFDQAGGSATFSPGIPGSVLFAPNATDAFIVKYAANENLAQPGTSIACDATVDVRETTDALAMLLIAPNPVERFFTISGDGITPEARITVHDVNGREVPVVFTRSSDRITVDAAHLDAGIYSVTIRSAIGQATTRFIKN